MFAPAASAASPISQTPPVRLGALFRRARGSLRFNGAGFIVLWEAQSQLATVFLIALGVVSSLWTALSVMIAWSLVATVVYYWARRRGAPDLLERDDLGAAPGVRRRIGCSMLALVKGYVAGLQAYGFSRTACRVLDVEKRPLWVRALRVVVVAVGLTLFGVATCEHLLRRAGCRGRRLLGFCLLGPFLNVPYRVLISATVAHAVVGLLWW